MFVSRPEYEFPIPPTLRDPGTQLWRLVELSLQSPWFLVSVEIVDPVEPDVSITRTLCVAWENDLADMLRRLDAKRVKGIVCMMPAWQSPTGQWWSREIREVWLHHSPSGEHIVLADADGKEFDCGLTPDHVGEVEKELLLRVDPRPAAPASNRWTRRALGHGKKST